MKKCIYTKGNHIEKYVLNLLDENEEIEFQKHLQDCEACFLKLQSIRKLSGLLSDEDEIGDNLPNEDKLPPRNIYIRYYIVAASITMIIGIGTYIFFEHPLSNHQKDIASTEYPVKIKFNVNDSNKTYAKIDESALEKENFDKRSYEIEKHIKEASPIEKIQSGQQTIIAPAPRFAKSDSTESTARIQDISFKMLNPVNKKTTVFLKNDAANIFEFGWQIDKPANSVLLIKKGKNILDKYAIIDKNNIEIDLSKYAQSNEIEWVLMVGDSENRVQGNIIIKK